MLGITDAIFVVVWVRGFLVTPSPARRVAEIPRGLILNTFRVKLLIYVGLNTPRKVVRISPLTPLTTPRVTVIGFP